MCTQRQRFSTVMIVVWLAEGGTPSGRRQRLGRVRREAGEDWGQSGGASLVPTYENSSCEC